MTEAVDNWDVLDDLIDREEGGRKEQDKFRNETRRPTTARKPTAVAEDWLGLRQSDADGTAETAYEPSSVARVAVGPNATRRQNFRRQSTQQRGSRSAGLLFGNDDDDDDGGGGDDDRDLVRRPQSNPGKKDRYDLFADDGGGIRGKQPVTPPLVVADSNRLPLTTDQVTKTRRRETSPTITVTAADGDDLGATRRIAAKNTVEKMPSWLSGLIQHKYEEPPLPPSSPQGLSVNETLNVQNFKAEEIKHFKETKEKPSDEQELDRLRSENYKLQLTIDHLSKKHELEIELLKTKYELQQNVLHEKLDRFEERINELKEERKTDVYEKLDRFEERINELKEERKNDKIERKENEMRLKETFEERLRVIHESHLIDLKQFAEVQRIKISNLEEVESSIRDLKPKFLTNEEMTAREISIVAQDQKLKDLQKEIDTQLATLEEERSALQIKIEEFQSKNRKERNELEFSNRELKRSISAFEEGRKAWKREKESEIHYIESRRQELEAVRSSVMEEQRKLADERFEVASERYRLESMLKMDTGTGTDLIQAKAEVRENFRELKKKEKDLEKRLEHVKELEKQLAEEKQKLQEQGEEIKIKSIRAEKMLKIAISKQEEGLKSLETAKDIQNKFDKKGKDIQNRLLDVIRREENVVQEESKLAKEKDAFNKQRKKLDFVLPHLNADEMHLFNPNKYEAEKEVHYKKTQLF